MLGTPSGRGLHIRITAKTRKVWGGIPVGPQSFPCKELAAAQSHCPRRGWSRSLRPKDRPTRPPHPAPGLSAGLPGSQRAELRSPDLGPARGSALDDEGKQDECTSTAQDRSRQLSHSSFYYVEEKVFAYSATSRCNWIAFIRTSNSYACLVGSCPLQRKMKPAGSGRTETVTKALRRRLQAVHWSVRRSAGSLEGAAPTRWCIKNTVATKQKPAALGVKYSTFGTAGKAAPTVRLGIIAIENINSCILLVRNLYRNHPWWNLETKLQFQ